MNRSTSCWPRKSRSLTPTPTLTRAPRVTCPGRARKSYDEAQPRAGRLVAEDEGSHPDRESDLVAQDVGIDGGAAGAEEAAVHLTDEDEDEIAGGPEG